jgi:hypothetical protein
MLDDGVSTLAEARQRHGSDVSDEELVLRVLISDGDVDAIRAHARVSGANSTLSSVHTLLRAVARRREITHLLLERPHVRVEVRR